MTINTNEFVTKRAELLGLYLDKDVSVEESTAHMLQYSSEGAKLWRANETAYNAAQTAIRKQDNNRQRFAYLVGLAVLDGAIKPSATFSQIGKFFFADFVAAKTAENRQANFIAAVLRIARAAGYIDESDQSAKAKAKRLQEKLLSQSASVTPAPPAILAPMAINSVVPPTATRIADTAVHNAQAAVYAAGTALKNILALCEALPEVAFFDAVVDNGVSLAALANLKKLISTLHDDLDLANSLEAILMADEAVSSVAS